METEWGLGNRILKLAPNAKFVKLFKKRFLYNIEKVALHNELPFYSNVVELDLSKIDFDVSEKLMRSKLSDLGMYFVQQSLEREEDFPKLSGYTLKVMESKFLGLRDSMLEIACALEFEGNRGGLIYGYNYVKGEHGELFCWTNVLDPPQAYEQFRQVVK